MWVKSLNPFVAWVPSLNAEILILCSILFPFPLLLVANLLGLGLSLVIQYPVLWPKITSQYFILSSTMCFL